ncbi:hypothetical protein [Desertibacillus haloalkaliphilus]|uniref:hypothetical protein n=1 Tax=Desertibacillus haloalkaliphilus TaxID=1328930 RepID=UPI001C276EC4|nr:hypothetical protein [Desertibacillus haloalkaliphilus]MBU8907651.1 hypothetical protein [Desertibacillus haloalkaliphilus]
MGKKNCSIASHNAIPTVEQPCDGTERTYFEDFTENHNKVSLHVVSSTPPPCTMFLFIETDEDPTPEPIPVLVHEPIGFGEISIVAENVRRIAVRCEGDETALCTGFIFFEKTFCICCP